MLELIANGAPEVAIAALGNAKDLATAIQRRLIAFGVLDPPHDGQFGQVSSWALGRFLKRAGLEGKKSIDRAVATALLGDSETLFPLKPGTDFAGKIVKAMAKRGDWVQREPTAFNIVYVEGVDPKGRPNDDAPDVFNDVRLVLQVNERGVPGIVDAWQATTEPGRHYTETPMNDGGAARVAFGQYKAWCVGVHKKDQPNGHEALVQVARIFVFRDLNKDFKREGDVMHPVDSTINQHGAKRSPKIGKWSAGCLVANGFDEHKEFMALVKKDPRYVTSNGYRFMTAVLDGQSVQ